MNQVLTPVPYYGAKTGIAPQIVSMIGPHRHYVEPYCGSLAVLLAKPPSYLETVNDLDGDLMTFWRILRDEPDELIRVAQLTPHSRAECLASQQLPYPEGISDLERARLIYTCLTQSRHARRRNTGWHYVIEASNNPIRSPQETYRRIIEASERLRMVTLESRPALEIIERFGVSREAWLYVDPPYLRDSGRNVAGKGQYIHDMPDVQEHIELAEALHKAQSAVMLSGYASELYDTQLYADWHRYSIRARSDTQVRDHMRDEIIWSNRMLDVQLDLFTME